MSPIQCCVHPNETWTVCWECYDAEREKVADLGPKLRGFMVRAEEAVRFYRADGTYETYPPSEVKHKRLAVAKELKRLTSRLEQATEKLDVILANAPLVELMLEDGTVTTVQAFLGNKEGDDASL